MTQHRLSASQFVPRPVEEVFRFFAEPRNLGRLTPAGMGFEFLSDDFEMRAGLEIDYRLRPLFGLPVRWRTQITEFEPPNRFRDVQLKGPYAQWDHEHVFRAVDGGTLIEDHVAYRLPLGRLGDVAHRPFVRPELDRIFRHRAAAIARIFAEPRASASPTTVAVAGGTGFVGGAIAAELFARGNRVIVLSQRGEVARGDLPDAVEIRQVDVTGDEDLVHVLADADALVVSLAFRNSPMEAPRRGQTFEQVDAGGTERLAAAARRAGVRHLVYISGAGAAPRSPKHWFRAKWRAEQAVRQNGTPAWTIIRPTWVYGPRDISLNRFLGFARTLQAVPMTNTGRQPLAPVFVEDIARLAADALVDRAAVNQVFEVGGPETLPLRQVIARALSVARLRRPIIPGPTPLIKFAALPLSVLPRPPLTPSAVDFINQPASVDIGPLLERMPRRLTTLDEGLSSYLGSVPGDASLVFDGSFSGSPGSGT